MKQLSNEFSVAKTYKSLCLSLVGALVILFANCVNSHADTTSGLIAYLPLDEINSLTAQDVSGNGHDGTLFNYPDATSEWVPGITNGALAVNWGITATNWNSNAQTNYEYAALSNSSINTLDFSTIPAPAFTLAAWVRGDPNAAVNGTIVESPGSGVICRGEGGGEEYFIDTYQSHFRFFVREANGTGYVIQQPSGAQTINVLPVSSNNVTADWQLIVGVYDSTDVPTNRIRLYVNGQLVARTTVSPTILFSSSHVTTIGAREHDSLHGYNLPFAGTVDDVRIYDRALSDSDVMELYDFSNSIAPPAAPKITQEPTSVSLFAEDPFTMSVAADGTRPLSYQWYINGNAIASATNASISSPYVQSTDAGNYTVIITNVYGSATSTPPAVLTVNPLPSADLTNNLILHYTFDETSGSTAHDSSGNAYDATLNNWASDAPEWEPGIIGGALRFNAGDATNNYVETPFDIAYSDTTNFTFTFWAKAGPETITGNPRFFATGDYQSWVVWAHGTGINFWNGKAGAPEPNTNTWHHYVVVFNRAANVYNVYVDGIRKVIGGVPTNPSTLADPTFYPWIIGHHEMVSTPDDQESFHGWLDDVRLYNRLLNWNDVEVLYESSVIASSNTTLMPALTISPSGNNKFTLSWPAWASNFVLQSTTNLVSGSWTDVPSTPLLNGITWNLTNVIDSEATYYRLHYVSP